MPINPLQQFFRQPKIYIGLPSKGVYNRPGTIQGDPSNIAVSSMTGMDEIIMRTPDALFSGESSVKIIESCCSSIKDAWDLSSLDIDMLFTAIRIATYGHAMTVGHTCTKCGNENQHELDLNYIIEHFNNCAYKNKIVLKDLIITIQPLTYRQVTDNGLKNYELRKKLSQTESITDEKEQQQLINDLWKELAEVQNNIYLMSIESVETSDVRVEERSFILEWIRNAEKSIFDAITKQVDDNKKAWQLPTFPVVCQNDECKDSTNITVELDQSNFFA